MKAKYDITVTFLGEGDVVKAESFSKVVFDYINDGRYFFVQEEDEKTDDENRFTNKLHWYPAARVISITGQISRTFETKEERKDYYAIKSGAKVKGNTIKN